jgi:hypothetical protein
VILFPTLEKLRKEMEDGIPFVGTLMRSFEDLSRFLTHVRQYTA